ncbi:hypothetical protein WKW80_05785 [Variovorax humicola]|uniref:Uncharacterized protein n=1 Tax=Variovorax humicola TaxID=1769758 RepID=A0ABU8VUW7_9BURK
MNLIVTAALVAASISANSGISSAAHNPELVFMSKQAVAAISWAKGKEAQYFQDGNYGKEAQRLRAFVHLPDGYSVDLCWMLNEETRRTLVWSQRSGPL